MEPTRDPADEPWWSPAGGADLGFDAPDEEEPIAGRQLTRTGRPARAPRPASLPPARAVAGAAVAVAGVALGLGTLLWATGGVAPPAGDPVVRPTAVAGTAAEPDLPAAAALDEPAVADPLPAAQPPAPAVPAPPPAAAAPQSAAQAPEHALVVPVLVLNNSRVTGLAERAARHFEAGGWPVRDTGNLRGRIRATTVYYPPGQEESARELARRFPRVQRVLPRLENLPGAGLTVVVTRDFGA